MLTRPTWFIGIPVMAALAVASPSSADEHRKNASVEQFLAAPSCEVPDHDSSGHFSAMHSRMSGLLGGSYGDIFFASGAGTRGSTATSTSTSDTSGGGVAGGGTGANAGGTSGSTVGTGSPGTAPGNATGQGDNSQGNQGQGAGAPGTGGPDAGGPGVGGGSGGGGAVNPEPASLVLLGTGLGGVLIARRRHGRRDSN